MGQPLQPAQIDHTIELLNRQLYRSLLNFTAPLRCEIAVGTFSLLSLSIVCVSGCCYRFVCSAMFLVDDIVRLVSHKLYSMSFISLLNAQSTAHCVWRCPLRFAYVPCGPCDPRPYSSSSNLLSQSRKHSPAQQQQAAAATTAATMTAVAQGRNGGRLLQGALMWRLLELKILVTARNGNGMHL